MITSTAESSSSTNVACASPKEDEDSSALTPLKTAGSTPANGSSPLGSLLGRFRDGASQLKSSSSLRVYIDFLNNDLKQKVIEKYYQRGQHNERRIGNVQNFGLVIIQFDPP